MSEGCILKLKDEIINSTTNEYKNLSSVNMYIHVLVTKFKQYTFRII